MATIMLGKANSDALVIMRLRSFLASFVSVARLARILSPLAIAPDMTIETKMNTPPSIPESKCACSVPHMKMEHTTPRIDNIVPMPTYFIFSPPYFIIRLMSPIFFNNFQNYIHYVNESGHSITFFCRRLSSFSTKIRYLIDA